MMSVQGRAGGATQEQEDEDEDEDDDDGSTRREDEGVGRFNNNNNNKGYSSQRRSWRRERGRDRERRKTVDGRKEGGRDGWMDDGWMDEQEGQALRRRMPRVMIILRRGRQHAAPRNGRASSGRRSRFQVPPPWGEPSRGDREV